MVYEFVRSFRPPVKFSSSTNKQLPRIRLFFGAPPTRLKLFGNSVIMISELVRYSLHRSRLVLPLENLAKVGTWFFCKLVGGFSDFITAVDERDTNVAFPSQLFNSCMPLYICSQTTPILTASLCLDSRHPLNCPILTMQPGNYRSMLFPPKN